MLVNICVHCRHHTQFFQLSAAELTLHMTLSLQCATPRRFTLKWHQILFITENEMVPCVTGQPFQCVRVWTCMRMQTMCVQQHFLSLWSRNCDSYVIGGGVFASPKGRWQVKCLGEQTLSADDANLLFLSCFKNMENRDHDVRPQLFKVYLCWLETE